MWDGVRTEYSVLYGVRSKCQIMADKFLDRVELEELKEEIKMTKLGQMLREDGIAEGISQGIRALIVTCRDLGIRKATINDLQVITAVEAECFPVAEAATEKDFEARLRVYPEHFWLLFVDEKLIGFVNGMATNEPNLCDRMYEDADMHEPDGAWQMIFGVNTIPEYRRQGCAAKFLEEAISDAKAQGRKGLVLTCKEKLIHYYAKFGFVNEGISQSVHGNVTWYQMRLTF